MFLWHGRKTSYLKTSEDLGQYQTNPKWVRGLQWREASNMSASTKWCSLIQALGGHTEDVKAVMPGESRAQMVVLQELRLSVFCFDQIYWFWFDPSKVRWMEDIDQDDSIDRAEQNIEKFWVALQEKQHWKTQEVGLHFSIRISGTWDKKEPNWEMRDKEGNGNWELGLSWCHADTFLTRSNWKLSWAKLYLTCIEDLLNAVE